jgi:hypothetical protein
MPNRDVHLPVGAVSGAAYAAYQAWSQPGPRVFAEATGGLVGGLLAGYASHLALDSLTPSSLPILC